MMNDKTLVRVQLFKCISNCKSGAHLGSENSLIHLKYGGLGDPQVNLRNKYE